MSASASSGTYQVLTPIDHDEGNVNLTTTPETCEVAMFIWLMLSGINFKMKEFTLGAFETGLERPEKSTLLAKIHSFLLLPKKKIELLRAGKPPDTILNNPYDWWTEQLFITVRSWIQTRRFLAFKLKRMEDAEDAFYYNEEKVEYYKENIAELDFLLGPIIDLDRIPEKPDLSKEEFVDTDDPDADYSRDAVRVRRQRWRNSRKDREAEVDDNATLEIESIMPFSSPEEYCMVPPMMRLLMLRALCLWRGHGFPDDSISVSIREFSEDSLRLLPVGSDNEGRRYYYFPMFYRDCRIYRETPQESKEYEKKLIEDKLAEKQRQKEEAKRKEEEAKRKREEAKRKAEPELKKKQKQRGKPAAGRSTSRGKKQPDAKKEEERLSAELIAKMVGRRSSRKRQKPDVFVPVKDNEESDGSEGEEDEDEPEEPKPEQQEELPNQSKKRGRGTQKTSDPAPTAGRRNLPRREAREKTELKKLQKQIQAEQELEEQQSRPKKEAKPKETRFIYKGPEPKPQKWELVCRDLDGLNALIDYLERNKRAHRHLVRELKDWKGVIEEEAATIRREQARLNKLAIRQVMPRKRSGRLAKVEAIQRKQERIKEEEQRRIEEETARRNAERREREEVSRVDARLRRQRERDRVRQLTKDEMLAIKRSEEAKEAAAEAQASPTPVLDEVPQLEKKDGSLLHSGKRVKLDHPVEAGLEPVQKVAVEVAAPQDAMKTETANTALSKAESIRVQVKPVKRVKENNHEETKELARKAAEKEAIKRADSNAPGRLPIIVRRESAQAIDISFKSSQDLMGDT